MNNNKPKTQCLQIEQIINELKLRYEFKKIISRPNFDEVNEKQKDELFLNCDLILNYQNLIRSLNENLEVQKENHSELIKCNNNLLKITKPSTQINSLQSLLINTINEYSSIAIKNQNIINESLTQINQTLSEDTWYNSNFQNLFDSIKNSYNFFKTNFQEYQKIITYLNNESNKTLNKVNAVYTKIITLNDKNKINLKFKKYIALFPRPEDFIKNWFNDLINSDLEYSSFTRFAENSQTGPCLTLYVNLKETTNKIIRTPTIPIREKMAKDFFLSIDQINEVFNIKPKIHVQPKIPNNTKIKKESVIYTSEQLKTIDHYQQNCDTWKGFIKYRAENELGYIINNNFKKKEGRPNIQIFDINTKKLTKRIKTHFSHKLKLDNDIIECLFNHYKNKYKDKYKDKYKK